MQTFVKNNIFFVVLFPFVLLAIAASYFRFMVQYDYLVSYEGFCDPYTEVCYEYCEDDECLEPVHYTWVERKAADLVMLCGENTVLDCEAASYCAENEQSCSVTHCDFSFDDDCEYLTEADATNQNN